MSLVDKLAALFRVPPRAAAPLPVATLVRTPTYTPTPAPLIKSDALDAEVARLWRIYDQRAEALLHNLTRIDRELNTEIVTLEETLAELQATPRFIP